MRLAIGALLCAGALGLCLAVPEKTVRWCTISDREAKKCSSLSKVLPIDVPLVSCVKRNSYFECIEAIVANEADAVTIEGGLMFGESLASNHLKPIVTEFYGSKDDPQNYHYVVAVVKKGSNFQLNQLQGKKSCHPSLGWFTGWNIPIEMLLPSHPGEEAAAKFFSSSCVPCADRKKFPNLCQLCAGKGVDKCACSSNEPYFGYTGAFKCLQNGGDVGFMRHMTVFENLKDKADRDQYELLCRDNTRKSVEDYKECHLAQVPSHTVVARSVGGKEDSIWELLNYAQENFGKGNSTQFQLFDSPHGEDLLFTDATRGFLRVPPIMDAKLYLGNERFAAIQHLRRGVEDSQRVRWCAVGQHERAKCDEWSAVSGGILQCSSQETTEDCIAAITKGEADAMTLDGGYVYIAGKCGLVPVMAENYKHKDGNEQLGPQCVDTNIGGYYSVAVVKKSDAGLTWNSLRGKKSCHPAVGTSEGWNIPMGLIYNQTGSCKFDEFFSGSCAPGSDPKSRLCALCSDSGDPGLKCVPNSREKYYGSSGALRCLVEKGDVAFVKPSAVLQNTNGRNSESWAKDLKQEDFELLCLDGTRKPVTEAQSCHLAVVPNHAVVSRKAKAEFVRRMLFNQQELFGRNGFQYQMFQLFRSSEVKDLLFSDETECLANLQDKMTYQKYLGPKYLTAIANVRPCLTSELLDACTFHGN
ncbi:inhibitor of carbonic anhydrase-like isoform X2 [Talpa occidentalis]|uniref:inhibitor of carbonic anhydrase-like isoform X2 n=1 Tax=Talpa occidentalis TaxID=50954 RepID=UPI00188EE359|nr:inhibitor of carbonic anhydrase-like isoform X2 [Talpa occidentalis]